MEIPARRSQPNFRRKGSWLVHKGEEYRRKQARPEAGFGKFERRAQSEAKDEMHQYRRSRENSDDASPATMENGDRFPKPARRRLMSQLWRIDGQLQHASPFIAAAALGQALTTLASADNSVVR